MEDHKTRRLIEAFVLACLILGLIITLTQLNNNTLPQYDESNNIVLVTVEPYKEETVLPDMKQFTDNDVGLSLWVPMEWQRVIKNGNTTFVDKDTASYISINKSGYIPGLNNTTEADVRSNLAANGCNFISFTPNGNFGYTLAYQAYENDVLYDYIEVVRIDRFSVVTITVCAADVNYVSLEKQISATVDSVEWNPQNPIPDNFLLAYNDFGSFEFGVPITWQRGIEDGEYVAKDPETGAEMHVSVFQSTASYANLTQGNFAEYIGSGKDGFSIKQFTARDDLIYCVSEYTIFNTPVYRVDYMIATGQFEYGICFICPTVYYQEQAPLFDQAFNLFRLI